FFRRAVGLDFRIRPCVAWDQVTVTVRPLGQERITALALADAAQLIALNHWQTAAECGVARAHLDWLVQRGLLFFCADRPHPGVGGAPLATGPQPLSLRHNVWPTPILEVAGAQQPFPFMPRLGALKHARLVGA